jgi:hypothetical protein
MAASDKKRILIVGGGSGGQKLAKELQKLNKKKGNAWQVTMLFQNPFVEFPMFACYYSAHHEDYHRYVGPQDVLDGSNKKWVADFAGVEMRVAQAIDMDRNVVKVKSSNGHEDSLPYDMLAVATGEYFGPILSPKPLQTLAERASELTVVSTTLARAKKCVVIGGGPIGAKVAGDYKEANPNCEVVLACRGNLRVKNWDGKEIGTLRSYLDGLGIKVLENLGELIEPEMPADIAACCRGATTLKFGSGEEVENVDLVAPAFTQGMNTSFVPNDYKLRVGNQGGSASSTLVSFGPGPVATNEFGQCLSHPNLFGIGAVASCETDFCGVPRYDDGAKLWALNMASVIEGGAPIKNLSQRATFKNFRAPFNLAVGHNTGGMLVPRFAPLGEGPLFQCCGFPFLPLFCPCFCACPFVCGWCCERLPSGSGRSFGKVMKNVGAKYKEGPLRLAPVQEAM